MMSQRHVGEPAAPYLCSQHDGTRPFSASFAESDQESPGACADGKRNRVAATGCVMGLLLRYCGTPSDRLLCGQLPSGVVASSVTRPIQLWVKDGPPRLTLWPPIRVRTTPDSRHVGDPPEPLRFVPKTALSGCSKGREQTLKASAKQCASIVEARLITEH